MQEFTGYEYLQIDAANCYGLDKELFGDRLLWTQLHMDELESLMDQADDPMQYIKAVRAMRDAQNHTPSGHTVAFDATASGMQVMGVMTGCETTCLNVGLIDPNVRADVYTFTTGVINDLLTEAGVLVSPSRKDVKDAQMKGFYGSTAEPKRIFGEDTPELEAFYSACHIVAPGACDAMCMMTGSWQPYALVHEWILPDFFHARVKVMSEVDLPVEVDELGHAKFTHRFYENVGEDWGISLPANITHSVDGMVVREVNRRCNYDPVKLDTALDIIQLELDVRGELDAVATDFTEFLSMVHVDKLTLKNSSTYSTNDLVRLNNLIQRTLEHKSFPVITVHDAFRCHPNNMNHLRQHYIYIMAELADSEILSSILSQIQGKHVPVQKLSENLSEKILGSNYAIC
jgi:hypothetical protein